MKERRHLMKEVVAPAAKLGGQMVKGVEPFDADKAAKAMNDINGVPDKYVTLFPEGDTAHGQIAGQRSETRGLGGFRQVQIDRHEAQGRERQSGGRGGPGARAPSPPLSTT